MNVRDMISNLMLELESSISNIVDGKGTIEQQEETDAILNSLKFYTTRLLGFGNDEIEGT